MLEAKQFHPGNGRHGAPLQRVWIGVLQSSRDDQQNGVSRSGGHEAHVWAMGVVRSGGHEAHVWVTFNNDLSLPYSGMGPKSMCGQWVWSVICCCQGHCLFKGIERGGEF